MIVTIGGQKGGTGKTTICTNIAAALARAGRRVLIIDTDLQPSTSIWTTRREERGDVPPVYSVQKTGKLTSTVREFATQFDEILIDTAGRDSAEFANAMLCAHVLISPVVPSALDEDTMWHVDDQIDKAKNFNEALEAVMVSSRCSTNPSVKELDLSRDRLGELNHLNFLDSILRDRKVYRDAYRMGLGVCEMNDKKAILEVDGLMREIYGDECALVKAA